MAEPEKQATARISILTMLHQTSCWLWAYCDNTDASTAYPSATDARPAEVARWLSAIRRNLPPDQFRSSRSIESHRPVNTRAIAAPISDESPAPIGSLAGRHWEILLDAKCCRLEQGPPHPLQRRRLIEGIELQRIECP